MKTSKTIQTNGINLQKQKIEAKELFNSFETPFIRYGQGIQVPLNDLDLNSVLAKENTDERMIINAPKEIKILSPAELSIEEQEYYWKGLISPEENKFIALHNAILNDAKIIIIPENVTCKETIKIKSHFSKKAKAESIIIIANKNSSAHIVEESSSEEEAYFKSQLIQVYAKENAIIEFSSIQNLSTETFNFTIKRGRVERDANISWNDLSLGGKFTQLHIQTSLICPNAQTQITGAYYANENQIFDLYSETRHRASNTTAILYNKGIICDNARTITRGKINIEKANSNCKAKQKLDNLIIGKKARCDAVPILEVENNDVSCSHGATISNLDEEKIFYITTRGIEEKSARNLILASFIDPIINKFPEEIIEKIQKEMLNKITK